MRFKRRSPCLVLAAMVLSMLLPAYLMAAEVDVFAEGAYSFNRTSPATTGKLVVYIYANINTPEPLCSYGVKLTYDSSKLNNPVATKNTAVWYMGASSPGNAYMDPDISTAGQIIFIGGKLDTDSPAEGVSGTRVLLGKVSFTRSENGDPKPDPPSYFNIGLALGKASPYDNFVTVGGVKKDLNTGFTRKVVEAGDANGGGSITATDAQVVGQIINNTKPWTIFADCNLSDTITATDAQCIGQKINGKWY